MIDADQAKTRVEEEYPGTTAVAICKYQGGFLVRVEFPSPEEKNFDPFFMVNRHNGDVAEFSVMADGDPLEVAEAFEKFSV